MDAQPAVDSEQASVKCHIMGGARGQAIAQVQSLARSAVFPRLDMACQEHALGAERGRAQTAEDAPATAIAQHMQSKHVLPDSCRSQQNSLGVALGPGAFGAMAGDLVAQVGL